MRGGARTNARAAASARQHKTNVNHQRGCDVSECKRARASMCYNVNALSCTAAAWRVYKHTDNDTPTPGGMCHMRLLQSFTHEPGPINAYLISYCCAREKSSHYRLAATALHQILQHFRSLINFLAHAFLDGVLQTATNCTEKHTSSIISLCDCLLRRGVCGICVSENPRNPSTAARSFRARVWPIPYGEN